MADKKRTRVFINTKNRTDLVEIIEKLKAETGIVFGADLVYQALRRWLRDYRRKNARPI